MAHAASTGGPTVAGPLALWVTVGILGGLWAGPAAAQPAPVAAAGTAAQAPAGPPPREVTVRDSAALGRWLGAPLRRIRGPVAVAAGPIALAAEVVRTPDRGVRLEAATLTAGPLELAGHVTVRRDRGGVALEAVIDRAQVAGLPVGSGQASLAWDARGGWQGTATLTGADSAQLIARLAPTPRRPQRCRGDDCPPPPPRLTAQWVGLDVGAAAAAWAPTPEGGERPWAHALSGRMTVEVAVGGPLTDAFAELTATGTLAYRGTPVGAVHIAARRAPEAPVVEARAQLTGALARGVTLTLRAPLRLDAEALAAVERPGAPPWAARLTVEEGALAEWTEVLPGLALAGQLSLTAEVDGRSASLAWDGHEIGWRGEPVGALHGEIRLADGVARGAARWGTAAAPIASIGGSIPLDLDLGGEGLTWRHTEALQLGVRATGLTPARLRPFWKAHPAADFSVDLQFQAEGTLAALTADGRLSGTLADGGRAPLPLAGALRLRGTSQRLSFDLGSAVGLVVETQAGLKGLREGSAHARDVPMTGRLLLKVPLTTLAPYLPGDLYDPQGVLDGRFTARGTLGEPAFEGAAALAGGAVTVVNLHQRLRDLALSVRADGQTLTVERFSARSGVGQLTGHGDLLLSATPPGTAPDAPLWSAWQLLSQFEVTGRRLPFVQALVPNGLADAIVSVSSVQGPGEADVQVTVREAKVDLTTVRLPAASAVPYNGRVQVLDWAGGRQGPDRLFAGDGHLKLKVILARPVDVRGDGVTLRLGGTLALDRDAERATVLGGFDVLEGAFTLFENRFRLRRGRLTLQGGVLSEDADDVAQDVARLRNPDAPPKAYPLEPVFDWLAEGEAQGTYVDMAIRGPARRPELVLASDPPLPEYRILTLLITGRVDAVDDRNGDVRRQVARLVDSFHNPSLSRQLYDRLGVDKLGLKFKALSQPVLTVGKQINRQLYLETVYHHNAPPDANEKEARVEYRLDPAWTLDTAYGDAAVGSVGVFWKRDFGGPPPQRRARRPLAEAAEP